MDKIDPKTADIRTLLEFVSKRMRHKGDTLPDENPELATMKMYLTEHHIVEGIFPVLASTFHANYITWCEKCGYGESVRSSPNPFYKYMKTVLPYNEEPRATYFYLNKEMQDNEENKKKRKETHSRKKKASEASSKEKAEEES